MKRRLSIRTMTVTFPLVLATSIVIGFIIWPILEELLFQTQRACASKDRIEKAVTYSMLNVQRVHHNETGRFLSDMDQFNKYVLNTDWRSFLFSGNTEELLTWKMSFKGHKNYATVSVFPNDPQNPSLLSYTGTVSYNAAKENLRDRYKIFMCSAASSNALPELHPVSESGGELKFECPKGTREDC